MIALVGRLLRVLFVLLVVRFVLRAIAGALRPHAAPAPSHAGAPSGVLDLVRDRVCNTHVPRDRAIRATVAGREEHFCSAACRDRARAAFAPAS